MSPRNLDYGGVTVWISKEILLERIRAAGSIVRIVADMESRFVKREDFRIVDCGNGLSFQMKGFVPARETAV